MSKKNHKKKPIVISDVTVECSPDDGVTWVPMGQVTTKNLVIDLPGESCARFVDEPS